MSRNRLLLALIGVLVLVGGLVFAYRSRPPARPDDLAAAPPQAGVLPSGTKTASVSPSQVGIGDRPVSVHYSFDAGVHRPITDRSGQHELQALGQNGGELRLVPQGSGLAVAYPDRCTLVQERECPRAILEGRRDDSLNPGTRPMRYGASVLMTHGDLGDGANVLQKGYSVGGMSQFKLQVDHLLGHPSCVLAGSDEQIFRAEPELDVADGRWHNLVCGRSGDQLTLAIDGVERARVQIPVELSIANAEPLRIGGKGAAKGNDQFAGEIDNVFLAIGI
jgi:hypothetical protein